jgi:ABC-type hemin transport system substrate-binding protein
MMDLFRYSTVSSLAKYLTKPEKTQAVIIENEKQVSRAQAGKNRLKERFRSLRP